MLARTLGSIGKAQAQQTVALVSPVQSGMAAFPDYSYETLYRQGYSRNEIVFACIEEWATDFAEPKLQAYRRTPNGPEVVAGHPAVAVWNDPNPWLPSDDLQAALQMYKRLAGNTFILKVRSRAGRLTELWLLRPDRVKVVPDRDKYISHYQYNNGTGFDDIPPENIVHLRTRHPFNDFYGMPPLMAAAARVDIDNFMRDVVKGFLANSGVPAGILRLRAQVSEQDKALFRSRFRTDFGGANSGNVMVVTGDKDSADYTPLALPLGARGLVIPELDEIDEARIPMVFRVPPSILGSRLGMNSSSYGNRKSDREEFTQRQLVPEWQSVSSALTQSLLPEFGGADFLAFDLSTVAALQQDMDAVSKRIISEVGAGLRSQQEGRKVLGLPPVADPNDTFIIPTNYMPMQARELESGAAPAVPALPAGQEGATRSLGGPEVIVINQQRPMRKRVEYDAEGRAISTVEEPIET